MAKTQDSLMEEEQEISKRDRKKLNKEKKADTEGNSSMQNKLLVVGAIVAVAAGAFWFMYRGGDSSSETVETPEVLTPAEVSAEDHVIGAENAVVTIVEYADYQCPACAAYNPVVKQLIEAFPDDLRVVSRHFPLRSIHRHAQIASQAAEAASEQGMFWEMAELLFEKQEEWSNVRDPRSLFVEYADQLAMNTEEFETYMNSDAARDRVNADYDGGFAAGVNSTPTFYVNGSKVSNPQGFEPFRDLVQQIIDQEKATMEQNPEGTDSGEATEEGDITPTL